MQMIIYECIIHRHQPCVQMCRIKKRSKLNSRMKMKRHEKKKNNKNRNYLLNDQHEK